MTPASSSTTTAFVAEGVACLGVSTFGVSTFGEHPATTPAITIYKR